MVFFKETVCGGDAAGGGCGAPLGVVEVTAENFEVLRGKGRRVSEALLEHLDSEAPDKYLAAPRRAVVLAFRPCRDCRE